MFRILSYIIYLCEWPVKAIVFFLFCHVMGYRKKVVRSNLKKAFPIKTEKERNEIEKRFYHNLVDVLVENGMVFALNKQKLQERIIVKNPEIFEEFARENISALCIGGHIANWEWGGMSIGNESPMHNIAVYLPLKNKTIDRMMRETRSKLTKLDTLVASKDIFKALVRAPRPFQTYIIADQSPSREHHHRVNFLGIHTAFFNGPAKMAKKLKLGMIYIETIRSGPGHYEVELKVMFKDPSSLSEENITEIYASYLEDSIRRRPADWLWSHKRWKF